jgi:hypothetical protein
MSGNVQNASFTGRSGNYTLDKSIAVHQSAHKNELFILKEPMSESKKVPDFIRGINSDVLKSAIVQVLGDPLKTDNFEACQQSLKTVHQAKQSNGIVRANRSVKQVKSNHDRRGKGKDTAPKGKAKPAQIADKDLHTGQCSADEHRALTSEQKTLIRDERLEAKAAGKVAGKRAVDCLSKETAVNSSSDKTTSDEEKEFVIPRKSARVRVALPEEEAPLKAKKAAGDQFGWKAHAAHKEAKASKKASKAKPKSTPVKE